VYGVRSAIYQPYNNNKGHVEGRGLGGWGWGWGWGGGGGGGGGTDGGQKSILSLYRISKRYFFTLKLEISKLEGRSAESPGVELRPRLLAAFSLGVGCFEGGKIPAPRKT
jgi:hypothetical protein